MIDLAIKVIYGEKLKDLGFGIGLIEERDLFAVKSPVFSMSKLSGVDTYLGPEMKSTGEVMGVDKTFLSAFIKSHIICKFTKMYPFFVFSRLLYHKLHNQLLLHSLFVCHNRVSSVSGIVWAWQFHA